MHGHIPQQRLSFEVHPRKRWRFHHLSHCVVGCYGDHPARSKNTESANRWPFDLRSSTLPLSKDCLHLVPGEVAEGEHSQRLLRQVVNIDVARLPPLMIRRNVSNDGRRGKNVAM